jgi:hypothetical protein
MEITRRTVLGTGIGGLALAMGNTAMSKETSKPGHVVLLGDSIFDNGVYVRPKPAVIDQLKEELPKGWKATLLAVDGDVAADVPEQLKRLPKDATHLVMSVGGNDALQASGVFGIAIKTGGEAFLEISKIRKQFDANYRATLKAVLSHGKPTAVCTIYDPNYAIDLQQQLAISGLTVFNDCITRAAARAGLPVIDLRLLFTGPDDYANSIEPSDVGGKKIVREIRQIVTAHDFTRKQTSLYTGV